MDGDAFQDRCGGDRHQFRFIVSPEDTNEMAELKPFVRDLVRDMERDLGTRLDWITIDHHDTGQPHAHLVVRGVRDDGGDLIMPRDYVSRGIRERAEELVRLELGPPTREQRLAKLAAEVDRTGVTTLDRVLDRQADADRLVEPLRVRLHPVGAMRTEHLAQRLQRLDTLGLAEEVAPARWCVADDLTGRLGELAERETGTRRSRGRSRDATPPPPRATVTRAMMTATGCMSSPRTSCEASAARSAIGTPSASAAARDARTAWKRKVPDPHAGSSTRCDAGAFTTSRTTLRANQSGV